MPHVDLPQCRIDYLEQGHGRPVVFVHGYLMAGELWQALADELAPQGFRCVMPTWPLGAHRHPLRPGVDASPYGQAAIIGAFLEALGLDDVVLVGNDSGGALCQVVVTRHPQRIGALVLTNCDAFDNFPPKAFRPLRPLAAVPGAIRAMLAPLAFGPLRRAVFGLLVDRDVDHLFADWTRRPREDPRIMADLVRVTRGFHRSVTEAAARALPGFDRPVLLTWGTDDPFFPLAHAERLRDLLPDARLETMPGKCFVMVDRPARVAGLIAGFAGSDAARTAGRAAARA
jgi:pimeloyl-ACP methyl ester carboxylesterase